MLAVAGVVVSGRTAGAGAAAGAACSCARSASPPDSGRAASAQQAAVVQRQQGVAALAAVTGLPQPPLAQLAQRRAQLHQALADLAAQQPQRGLVALTQQIVPVEPQQRLAGLVQQAASNACEAPTTTAAARSPR